MIEPLVRVDLSSPLGTLSLVAADGGLLAVVWPDDRAGRVRIGGARNAPDHPILRQATQQLREYFAAERRTFDVPLEPRGTEFQVKAWRALAHIAFGETVSYAAQAKAIGHANAVRAIGAANGRNPLSLILPCHRVVGSNGALTGYAGGIDAKAALLDFEQRVLWGDCAPMPTLGRITRSISAC